jgi:hypothetical protein
MELCRFGSLYKVVEYARRVSWLPALIRDGQMPPRTPEEKKLKACPSTLPSVHSPEFANAALGGAFFEGAEPVSQAPLGSSLSALLASSTA